jgi:alpha-mannosidase
MPDFGRYTRRKLDLVPPLLREHVYTRVGELRITAWRTPEPVAFGRRRTGQELHLRVGDT